MSATLHVGGGVFTAPLLADKEDKMMPVKNETKNDSVAIPKAWLYSILTLLILNLGYGVIAFIRLQESVSSIKENTIIRMDTMKSEYSQQIETLKKQNETLQEEVKSLNYMLNKLRVQLARKGIILE